MQKNWICLCGKSLSGNKRYCLERGRVQFSRAEVILLHPAITFIFLSPVLDFSPSLIKELMLGLLGSPHTFVLMSAMKTASHLQIFAKQQFAYSFFFSICFTLFFFTCFLCSLPHIFYSKLTGCWFIILTTLGKIAVAFIHNATIAGEIISPHF